MSREKVFKSAGVVARFDKKESLKLAKELVDHLYKKGVEVYVEDTLPSELHKHAKAVPLSRMKTDFIITIGGDGTILRTCLALPKPEPPILAINMSVRGFLTEAEPKQALEVVEKCLQGEYIIERCMKLAAATEENEFPDALNEVVAIAEEPTKLLYMRILKDKEHIVNCQADGLMVSTQTGSTGYSLSAGGPVLDPEVNSFVLTPLCPLTPFHPIVFPAKTRLTIEVEKPKRTLVIIDGHHRQLVSSEPLEIAVTKSKNVTSFIRMKENFYHRLRSRLLFKGSR
ncbi:MAG: NAD(+)/NADH kinase [Candidatus Bathyarchaeota archaeon]|nr:NAD(+)/NADH kinase [Candidatus Bathyarchaeota archaeon]